jgi:hypothetical protein
MRIGRTAALAALGVLGVMPILDAPAQSATPNAARHVVTPEAKAMKLNLRLADLPPGYAVESDYEVGSDGSCYRSVDHILGTPDLDHRHVECTIVFHDNWRPPGSSRPETVESVTLRFKDVAAATAGFAARHELAYGLFEESGDPSTEKVPATPLGDESRVWSSGTFFETGAIVAWRSGRVVSFIGATQRSEGEIETAALALAALQQRRVANPTPLLPADNDDSEVALDSPRLEVDPHWLGRRFEPGAGLPALEIFDSQWLYSWDEGPDWSASVVYVAKGGGVSLSLWKPRNWTRYKRGVIGRRVFRFSCKPRRVKLPRGHAIVHSTKDRRHAPCGRGSTNHFFATVHLAKLVVTINEPGCVFCVGGSDYGAFNSAAAMRAVARGLQPRR